MDEPGGARMDWESMVVGTEASIERTVTAQDVEAFAALTGDRNPLHLDAAFAARTRFGRPIAHGMLTASYVSTVIGMALPGPGALWTALSIEFRRPVFAGDEIRVVLRVRQRSEATRTLVLAVTVLGPGGQEVITGEATVHVLADERATGLPHGREPPAVLVAGGGRGLGSVIAARIAADGRPVILAYRADQVSADATVRRICDAGGNAIPLQADIADATAVDGLVRLAEEQFGPIGAVVHAAADASALKPLAQLPWEAMRDQLETQVHGAFNLVRSTLPGMIARKGGRYVFIGSVASDASPPAHQADYVVAKAALVALARSLAVDHGVDGILANVVAPGMTSTGISLAMPERARMVAKMQSAIRQLTEPDEVASIVAFLLSDGARQITGQTIRVGGSSMA